MLTITNLERRFISESGSTVINAVAGISLDVRRGEFFTLLGPSGCGKTTTLRCIAGLELPTAGRITINDRVVYDADSGNVVSPEKRSTGMVFQSYAIWPHMTVFENVAFPFRVQRSEKSKDEVKATVSGVLKRVGLEGYEHRSATKLSGGQQQRLALARACVWEPDLLLLDEPLSNLDARLREDMRVELKRLQRDLGITCVYVTHDQAEALALSDRIAVMDAGKIVQIGTPEQIYAKPQDIFVARFVGVTNCIEATATASCRYDEPAKVETRWGVVEGIAASDFNLGDSLVVTIRSEDLRIAYPGHLSSGEGSDPQNCFAGVVRARMYLGDSVEYSVDLANGLEVRLRAHASTGIAEGELVSVSTDSTRCRVYKLA